MLPQQEVTRRGGHTGVGLRQRRDHLTNHHQPIGARVRQRPQQDRVDEREDRGVGPHADGHEQHHQHAEPRLPSEHPDAVAQVLHQRVDRGKTGDVPVRFLDLTGSSEPTPCLPACRVWRPTTSLEIRGEQQEMRLDLIVVLTQPAAASNEAAKPGDPGARGHVRSSEIA